MLRVTIEVVPQGDESRKRTIKTMTVSNVTSRMGGVDDYECTSDGRTSLVRGHPRLTHGAWALVYRAIRALNLDLR